MCVCARLCVRGGGGVQSIYFIAFKHLKCCIHFAEKNAHVRVFEAAVEAVRQLTQLAAAVAAVTLEL